MLSASPRAKIGLSLRGQRILRARGVRLSRCIQRAYMLVLPKVCPAFPAFPGGQQHHTTSHHTAKHEGGKKILDIYAVESGAAGTHGTLRRLGGDEDPTKLYEYGPRTWPSLALRAESDAVMESSGIIGWYAALSIFGCNMPHAPQVIFVHRIKYPSRWFHQDWFLFLYPEVQSNVCLY